MQSILAWLKAHLPQIFALFIWGIVIVVICQYMLSNDLTFEDIVRQLGDVLVNTWYGPLIYIIVYMLRPLLFFPASLLTVLAGNVYGLWFGFAVGLLAGTLSAIVPYGVGWWFWRSKPPGINESATSSIGRFAQAMRRAPFQSILVMRLLYLPYDTVSFFAGGLRMALVPFFFATAIGNIAGTFAFIGIGASIEGDITQGDISLNPVVFLFSVLIFVISIGVSWMLNKRPPEALIGESNHD